MISYWNSPPCSPRHLWHIWPRDPMMIEEQIRKSLRTLLKLHRRDWHWETINLGDPKELQKKRPNPDWSNLWSLFCPGLVQAWQIFHVDRILKMQLQVLILTLYMPRTVHEFMVFLKKWYFVSKMFWPTVRILKFDTEGREFPNILRSPEQSIQ